MDDLLTFDTDTLIKKIEDLRAFRNLMTDPDLAEKADGVVAQVEAVLLGDDDATPDFLDDKVADYWREEYETCFGEDMTDAQQQRIIDLEGIVQRALNSLIESRLRDLLAKREWRN